MPSEANRRKKETVLLAIALNLVSIIVIVGGWTLAVRGVYKGITPDQPGPQHLRLAATNPQPEAARPAKHAA